MIKKNIPNFITLLNLVSGLFGIVFLFKGEIEFSIYMILLSAAFDFLDGTAARLLKAYSDIGKSLDSLADLVSFGVLPGLIVYKIAAQSLNFNAYEYAVYFALIIPVFGAVRLAVFENDDRQKEQFRGIPIPANALFIAALSMVFWFKPDSFLYFGPAAYFFLAIGFSVLQVVFVPVISLKFKSFAIKENLPRYLVLLCAIILISVFGWEGVLFTLVAYIIISLVFRK